MQERFAAQEPDCADVNLLREALKIFSELLYINIFLISYRTEVRTPFAVEVTVVGDVHLKSVQIREFNFDFYAKERKNFVVVGDFI